MRYMLIAAILVAGVATVATAGNCNTNCNTYGNQTICRTTCVGSNGEYRVCTETCTQYGTQVSCNTVCN